MAVSMLSGETRNFLEYTADNNGDVVDPDTYDDVIIYVFWQINNKLAASYSILGTNGHTKMTKIPSGDNENKLPFTLLPASTEGDTGNLMIQVNIVDGDSEITKKKTVLAIVLKAY